MTSKHQNGNIVFMRTTLTLDDDVARMLEALRKERQISFKQVVNDVLRRGLVGTRPEKERPARYETPELNLGPCKYPDLDNVSDVLAVAEREDFR